jgi:alanine racemase
MAEKKKLSEQFPFKPCLKLVARPISLRGLKKDTSVSYGETFKIKHETETVGVIPLGYADGIPRQLSNNIIFDNHPLLGRVTMDQIVVGGMSGSFDEYVELLGVNSPPLEFWADQSGTITYQIMTNLGDRIQRKLV